MRIFTLSFLILYSVILCSQKGITSYSFDKERFKNIGKQFFPFTAESLNGDIISNKDLDGKITIINFWFEGCAPCIAEFDALKSIYSKFSNNSRFQFVSFTKDYPEYVSKAVKKYNLSFPVYPIGEKCYDLNFGSGFPTTFILDEKSRVIYCKIGGQIDKESIADDFQIIEQILLNLL